MNVPVLEFLLQSNTGNNRLGHETRFPQQSSHHVMGNNNLICFVVFFFGVVLFTERCLSRKPTRPCLRFWQQRHIPRLQQTSCTTLMGHLNNAFDISRKKNLLRVVAYGKQQLATINREAAVWAGKYGVCKCKASPRDNNY